VQDCHKFEL